MYRLPLYGHNAARERMSRWNQTNRYKRKFTNCARFWHFVMSVFEGVEVVLDVDGRSPLDGARAKENVRLLNSKSV